MTARWSLVVLILGTGLGSAALPDRGAAQVPPAQHPPGPRPDAARLKALHDRLHKLAASLNDPKASPAAHQPAKPSFNPYPHGREPRVPPLPRGYHPDVHVLAPGRLDWTFVVSRQSLDPEPTALTAGYVSTRQSYELYVPPGHGSRQPYGLILHIPTGARSDGWQRWQKTCQRHGFLLAGVHNAGNDVPLERRARVVLDVLDDVRRRFPVDPDRTYITGMSGGGHASACIAHALPELFGGHIAICGEWNLRVEPMPRLRVRERLSVAVLTGATDFNRPELEREFYPILCEERVRGRLGVYPGIGHACPNAAQLEQVFQWVEAGLPQRRLTGAAFPASRLARALSPEEWSTAVLLEAGQRLGLPGEEGAGLFLLEALVERWQGLPAAEVARKLLDEFDAAAPVPSGEIFKAERLRFRYLQARTFDGIVNSTPPPDYPVPRINLLQIALALWQEVHDLAPTDGPVYREATARLAVLHQQIGK